ncbi:MAG: hypothetical protein JRH20_31250, partial [Deltaproteobacteria bacterium]|nr:hypothetical protein [Deltaproteobacteria bacterium]
MERWFFTGAQPLAALLCLLLAGCVRTVVNKAPSLDAGERIDATSERDAPLSEASGLGDAPPPEATQSDLTPAPPDDENRSSARFKRLFTEAEGVRQYHYWFDTEFNLRCTLGRIADGTIRCLPYGTLTMASSQPLPLVFYADATCTKALFTRTTSWGDFPKCPGASVTWTQWSASVCTTGLEALFGTPYSELRLIAASPVTPSTVYSRLADGSCVEDTSVPPDPLHEMTTIDTKALPEFTQETISHGKRLDTLVWRAADGATLYGASFDTQRTMICRIRNTVGGGAHCIPMGRTGWIHSYYVDDQCTVLAGSRKSADCEAPQYFTRSTKTACGVSASEIFEAGAELGQTYVLSNSICEGPTPSSGQFYEIGPPLALTDLAEAKPLSVGMGRLRHVYYVADGTSRSDHLYDTHLGTPCHFIRAADGTMRCLPSRVASVSYLDSACTQPFSYLDCPDAA